MSVLIRHNILSIPVMLVNFVNSRGFNTSVLHQFSSCCKSRVKYKKVCGKCGKELNKENIVKGTDEEHILTQDQQDRLKEQLENQTIDILSFEKDDNLNEDILTIQKSMLVLPSISKGFKKRDLDIFESFKQALKETETTAKVKYTTRGKEHIGILKANGNDLIFLEYPFYNKLNRQEINRLKTAVDNEKPQASLKDYAKNYIKENSKELELEEIQEKRSVLIEKYLENAINGDEEIKTQETEKELNPFAVEK